MSLANKLVEERRARLAAERLLEQKQAELQAANRKLGRHAQALSEEIVETRAEVQSVLDENERVKSDLTLANDKLEIAETRLWHSIEAIEDGFAFFDADSQLIGANQAWLSVFDGLEEIRPGISYVEILQCITEEGIVDIGDLNPFDWREQMLDRWQTMTPEPQTIRLWNGSYVKLIDQRNPRGDVVSLALDITDTIRNEKQLKDARSKAEAANRAKSSFLANMSHEIRTPMNGVVGMADLLKETPLDDEQQLYANTIKNSGEALLVIINDVLDYSKIEAEKLVLIEEAFDLERCIHELVMLMQANARDKGIDLLVDYDLFLPTQFIGDPGRIRQVLTNLLGNAVKFTEEGHVLIRVVGFENSEDATTQLHITIEDTGIGIPEDMVGHIFGEFNQVEDETNRKFEGTGLGLAISEKLIRLMGGEIWVESKQGEGSTFGFSVRLPVAEAQKPTEFAPPPGLDRILLVEASALNRDILERQFRSLGVEVMSCHSGKEALQKMTPEIDMVISDHIMAEMDGIELAEAIKTKGFDAPVLLLSANTSSAEQDPGREHVGAVVHKPVLRRDLFAAVQGLADQLPTQIADLQPDCDDAAPPENAAIHEGEIVFEHKATKALAVPSQEPRAMRILAAEDNKTNRLVFSKMLKALDIDLQFAENGKEAVALYQSFEPDLIFTDISMPEMDGKEAAAAIRALEEDGDTRVPIVAMTAHAMAGDDEAILAAGIDHYLTKPLSKEKLIHHIMTHCPQGARAPLEVAPAA